MSTPAAPPMGGGKPPVREALEAQRPAFKVVAFQSLVVSLMVLAPTWFMLEVYDRVVNSRNERTLWMLGLAVLIAYIVMELIDLARYRVLAAIGEALDAALRERLFNALFAVTLRRGGSATTQAFTDLRTLREFVPSGAVTAVFDSPAAVIFLIFVSAISPWLGVMSLVGAMVQMAIAWSTERRTMPLLTEANKASMEAGSYAGGALRNAQVIESMGMIHHIHKRWAERQHKVLLAQADASDHAGLNSMATRQIQLMLGSLILGAACWLELQGSLAGSSGMMLVASILGGRVLLPLAQLVAQWRLVVNARDAMHRVDSLLASSPESPPAMPLPAPKGHLSVEGVVAGAPTSPVPIIKGVSFVVKPGEAVAVVGPSAAGKTTLARLLVGLWPAVSGKVRLDGVDVFGWDKNELGPHMGYLPQNVELFEGTIGENVARFGSVDEARIQEALDCVGMLDWVKSLPDGIHTRIGEEGATLSGGQRQRVGLARAVYGKPRLLVLDEPNASLDEAGEAALLRMVQQLKASGATVIVITHRTAVLPVCDKLLVLRDGQLAAFGPRDEVMAQLRQAAEQAARPAARPAAGPAAARPAPVVSKGGAA